MLGTSGSIEAVASHPSIKMMRHNMHYSRFFDVELGSVHQFTRVWLRCLGWLAVAMLPLQHLAANVCFCPCQTGECQVADDHEHGSCDRGCCDEANDGCNVSKTPGFQDSQETRFPCGCPVSCPCHLREAPQPGTAPSSSRIARLAESPSMAKNLHVSSPVISCILLDSCLECRASIHHSALALCATLCRFTT
jgi:hypothetical protein